MKKPVWILEATVIKIHDAQLAEFGGAEGIRDPGLLGSALHYPQHLHHYGEPSIVELATAYAERLAKNHPFADANKRTAYVVTVLFLRLNGYKFIAPKEERVIQFVRLAASQISAEEFATWLRENVQLV
jgi:death-on-curing protein